MDALINPATRDYMPDVGQVGALARDPAAGLLNAAYLRLTVPLGMYFADATIGSRLHELEREKDVARVAHLAKVYAEQALAPLLADGRATAIVVRTLRLDTGRLGLTVELIDARGVLSTFSVPVKVV